jgi:hypothetical protein
MSDPWNQPRALFTRAVYDKMTPRQQGYTQYMEGEWPGSELKDLANPYEEGTGDAAEWMLGQQMGVLAAQDSEE